MSSDNCMRGKSRQGAVGGFIKERNLFQFQYMNVPMVNMGADGNGNETFTLKRLEVIGRIDTNGLDIEVSMII